MGESLIQLYRMGEEGSIGCKALIQGGDCDMALESSPG